MLRRLFLTALVAPAAAATARAPVHRPVVERARFGPADRAHGHDALGVGRYPGRFHATIDQGGTQRLVDFTLADSDAFEDGLIRQADLDGDGLAEFVQVRASRMDGAAITVLALARQRGQWSLIESARSPAVGAGRWLNPVGMADFDGDGRLEVVAVTTPHIGGVLTLYRYSPPHLIPIAQERNVSNHVLGQAEQRLAAIFVDAGRTVVAIPDQRRLRLRFLSPAPSGGWTSVRPDLEFDQPIDQVRLGGANRLHVQAGGLSWTSPWSCTPHQPSLMAKIDC